MISAGNRDTISSNKGFSLLEMIVAITLVAMMAVGLWAVFSMSIRAWSRGTEFIDTNQRHRSILDLVRKQIASTYGLTPVDLQAEGILAPLFVGTGESLSFISLNSLQFQESPGLTLVSYEVVQNSGGSYALVEMEQPYLGTIPDLENNMGFVLQWAAQQGFRVFIPSHVKKQIKMHWLKSRYPVTVQF